MEYKTLLIDKTGRPTSMAAWLMIYRIISIQTLLVLATIQWLILFTTFYEKIKIQVYVTVQLVHSYNQHHMVDMSRLYIN